jgi:capsular polysaccharide biosynthesis protein
LIFSLLRRLGLVHQQQLYPGQHIVRPWPANLREQDRVFFAKNREYELLPNWLLRFRRASLYWDGLVFHGLHLYPETLVQPHLPVHNWRGLLHMRLRMVRKKLPVGPQYLLAHDGWSLNYYHWLVDALPRLLAVREQLPGMTLLLPANYTTDYHQQTLHALGVAKIEYLDPNTRYVVPDLLVPTRLARVASNNPAAMRQLRQVLRDAFPSLHHASAGERVYISRARAPRRKVLNEAEVIAYLREQGFAVVQLEDYSFCEQVSIMAQVRCLVSIHGAGLANMLFMQPGGRVLELQMQDDGTSHYYYTLAADLDISYYYQFCAPSDAMASVQDADLMVNIDELAQTVAQLLKEA